MVSFFGGSPDGLMIFGFFFVEAPTAAAIFLISAVGVPSAGCAVVAVVVVSIGAEAVDVSLELGISAVLVPPPQAARPTQAAPSASNWGTVLNRVTAGNLAANPSAA